MPEAFIQRVELIPDIDDKSIKILVHGSPSAKDAPVLAEITANNNAIATGHGTVGKSFSIDIPNPKLWSPDSPFLYDLELTLEGDSPHTAVSLFSDLYSAMLMLYAILLDHCQLENLLV